MKNFIFEDIAIDDVIIQDPNIANQIVQIQKQINEKLKRIAQYQSEIAILKQNIIALKDRAIQAQKANLTTAKAKPPQITPESNQQVAGQQSESWVPSLDNFLMEDENYEAEKILEDDTNVFFVQIPPQTELDGEVIAKVFREDENQRWYVRDVEEEAEFLDELVFQKNYSKPEIIGYLAAIFGDVLEIDREEFDELIDDKEELDNKYFPNLDNPEKNIRVKLR